MRRVLTIVYVAGMLVAGAASAQEGGAIVPLPAVEDNQQRIVPAEQNAKDAGMLTTHKVEEGAPAATLPWQKTEPAPANAPGTKPALPFTSPFGKVPFGHAEPAGPVVPSGPHTTVAVPVVNVDAVEASEAAPATPVADGADPAKEDPSDPTELTSPIFEPENGVHVPRKLVLRVLNKVTGQSQLITLKPSENVRMGQLQITAVNCQTSAVKSQTDHAGLIDISEQRPGEKTLKQLFRGWMYASSPSITALEHPVYDVTMVECVIQQPAAKKEAEKPADKVEKKPVKPVKKP